MANIDKKAFYSLTCGVFALTVDDGKTKNGCIINTALQVTSEPACLSVTVNKLNKTAQLMLSASHFAVTVLSNPIDMDIIKRFGFQSGNAVDKFADFSDYEILDGQPIITNSAVSAFVLEKLSVTDVGTHIIFVGKVISSKVLNSNPPLTYSDYHKLKNGYTPPNAPSFIADDTDETQTDDIYVCPLCGFEHKGKPSPDYRCPICGAAGSTFKKK